MGDSCAEELIIDCFTIKIVLENVYVLKNYVKFILKQ